MISEKTNVEGVVVFVPAVFGDDRGYFRETFQAKRYAQAGIGDIFVQDNHSHSGANVLRGFHFQTHNQQAQLITVFSGAIFAAFLDVRLGSPSFAKHHAMELSAENGRQVYTPPGVASAFCVVGDHADVLYKVTRYYDPAVEGGVLWSDPDVGVLWPLANPIMSARDAAYPRLRDISRDLLPTYPVFIPDTA